MSIDSCLLLATASKLQHCKRASELLPAKWVVCGFGWPPMPDRSKLSLTWPGRWPLSHLDPKVRERRDRVSHGWGFL